DRSQHFRRLLRQISFGLCLQALASAGLLAVGGYLVINEHLSLGQLVAAEIVVALVVASFSKLGKQLESYYDLLAAVDKLGYLQDLPHERLTGDPLPAKSGGLAISIFDVAYAYHDHPTPAVNHITHTIQPGSRVAIVGPNGSGKSTLLDLILGLRVPEHGRIEYDGLDLRSLGLESVRDVVAVVRALEFFEGTILENLRMGRAECTLEAIRAALEKVDLYDVVMNLPEGLNTPLTPGGAPLSLGQANRLMIARALLAQPRLLVLDESIDGFDPELQKSLLAKLLAPNPDRTTIIITHRPDIMAACDQVISMTGAS
ncbi:MAG: ATP-binding cassette domain-containing protein, partial [Gemmataceae bacterium]